MVSLMCFITAKDLIGSTYSKSKFSILSRNLSSPLASNALYPYLKPKKYNILMGCFFFTAQIICESRFGKITEFGNYFCWAGWGNRGVS